MALAESATGEGNPRITTGPGRPGDAALIALTDRLISEGVSGSAARRRKNAFNRAFYVGNTRAGWDPIAQRISGTPRFMKGVADDVEWASLNIYRPAIDIATSFFTSSNPEIRIETPSTDSRVLDKKRACEAYTRHEYHRQDMASFRANVMKAVLLDADAYVLKTWDATAGKPVGKEPVYETDPVTGEVLYDQPEPIEQPVLNPETGEPLLDADGLPINQLVPQPKIPRQKGWKILYAGEPRFDLYLADQVITDTTARTDAAVRWHVLMSEMSPEAIFSEYGMTVEADSNGAETYSPSATTAFGAQKSVQVRMLLIAPGNYAVGPKAEPASFDSTWCIVSTRSKVLCAKPLPPSKHKLPVFHLRHTAIPGEYLATTPADDLREAQLIFSTLFTQTVTCIKRTASPKLMWPIEADIQEVDFNNLPGAKLRYSARGLAGLNVKPDWMDPAPVPFAIVSILDLITDKHVPHLMGQHRSGLAGGNDPSITAGYHYRQVTGHDMERMGAQVMEQKRLLEWWADSVLEYAQQNIREDRMLALLGGAEYAGVSYFSGSQVDPSFGARCTEESITPQTKEAKFQRMAGLRQLGLLDDPREARKMIGREPDDVPTLEQQHEDMAERENFWLVRMGQIPRDPMDLELDDDVIHEQVVKSLLLQPWFTREAYPQQREAAFQHWWHHAQRNMKRQAAAEAEAAAQNQGASNNNKSKSGQGGASAPSPAPPAG